MSTGCVLPYLLNLAAVIPPSQKTRYSSVKRLRVIHLLPPSTHWAGPHAPTAGAPSLLSFCHYAVVNSTVYSVINHHLEGSAGS